MSGHENIDGNEQADQAAKAAVISNNLLFNIRMRSTQKRSIQTMIKIKWETEWKTERNIAKHLRKMSQHSGTITGLKLYEALQ
jgi:hypothetical protein